MLIPKPPYTSVSAMTSSPLTGFRAIWGEEWARVGLGFGVTWTAAVTTGRSPDPEPSWAPAGATATSNRATAATTRIPDFPAMATSRRRPHRILADAGRGRKSAVRI